MLTELKIKNFAIIEEQSISFGSGLNVISGESGAGKSIVLQALELILGERGKAHYVREGSSSFLVEARFDLSNLGAKITDELPDIARESELVISRSGSEDGKGKIYINGRLGTLALLQEISAKIINICGQNQQARLLEPNYQLELLDEYCDHGETINKYRDKFNRWRALGAELSTLSARASAAVIRKQGLEEALSELSEVRLEPGLRVKLEEEIRRLSGADKLRLGCASILSEFEDELGVPSRLSKIAATIQELTKFDPTLSKVAELFVSAQTELNEFEADLTRYSENLSVDEEKLDALRERLAEVARLERKYRRADLELLFSELKGELEALSKEVNLDLLEKEHGVLESEIKSLAQAITSARKKGALQLSKQIVSELSELNMSDTAIEVEFESSSLSSSGAERAEFVVVRRGGSTKLPIRKVASGGELSRLMLVLKKLLRDKLGVNVLVFDEVDTGISGGVARAVGEKLKALSKESQVLCITHLPQIASLADHHFKIDKLSGSRPLSVIRELGQEEKIDEIARMLAGYTITSASRESARELLSSKI